VPGNSAKTRIFSLASATIAVALIVFWLPVAQAQQSPESPLFVPVVPGEPPPIIQPELQPGESSPSAPPTPFIPSDIPAPGIQSQPVTMDFIEQGDEPPRVPAPMPTPRPTPILQTGETSTTPAVSPTPKPRATPRPAAPPRPARPATQAEITRVASRATETRDPKAAEQVGWMYYNRDDFSSAAFWFEQALEWNRNNSEAAYGLALSKMRAGELSSAEALANAWIGRSAKMRTLLGDIYVRRAVEAYEVKRYRDSVSLFDQATNYRTLSRNERVILAWSLYRSGQTEESAVMFEQLYRSLPDQQSAEGLYTSLSKLREYDRLSEISAAVPGPLGEVYATYDAQEYYKTSLFRASFDSDGDKIYPVLEGITGGSLEAGFAYRQKSGQEGESALTELRAPYFEARFYPSNRTEIIATVGLLSLDAGDLPPGANVGTPPREFAPYNFGPTTKYDDLFEFRIRFEYQGWITPYIELGTTPINGPLQPRPVGKLGLIYRHLQGYVQAEFYSRSIKESLLSYVGMQDPYTGRTWGRVTETGFAASVFQSITQDWTFFAGGSIGSITGDNVASNEHVSGTIAVARLLEVPGFEYFTVGPAFSYESFSNNQNFFTYGNGGYFSPAYIAQAVVGVNALTTEGEQWIVKGMASAGAQTNQQDSAPYFPLNPDGRTYPSTSSSTGVFLVDLEGGILITPTWMLGGRLAYTVTADYNEGWASIYVRYMFEQRNGLLRSDLGSGFR